MKHRFVLAAMAAAISSAAAMPTHAKDFEGPSAGIELATEEFESYRDTTTTLIGGWDFALASQWRVGLGVRWTADDVEERGTEALGSNVQDISVAIDNRRGVTARLGRVVGEEWMVFAEAGYERYDVEAIRVLRAPVCAPPTDCVISRLDGSFSESMTSVGVGIEWAAAEHARVRATFNRGNSDAFDRNRLSLAATWAF